MLAWELKYVDSKKRQLATALFQSQDEVIKFARKNIKPSAWGYTSHPVEKGDSVLFYLRGIEIARATLKEF